jgi:hypothetical protein
LEKERVTNLRGLIHKSCYLLSRNAIPFGNIPCLSVFGIADPIRKFDGLRGRARISRREKSFLNSSGPIGNLEGAFRGVIRGRKGLIEKWRRVLESIRRVMSRLKVVMLGNGPITDNYDLGRRVRPRGSRGPLETDPKVAADHEPLVALRKKDAQTP